MNLVNSIAVTDAVAKSILDGAPDAVIVVNGDGRILYSNRQVDDLFGYASGALLGETVEVLVPAWLRGSHAGHRRGYQSAPRTRAMGMLGEPLFAARCDGSVFPVEISLSPIQTPDGSLVSCTIRDVSARVSIEHEVRQKDIELEKAAAKDRFLASMSHELRTPLNAIVGFATMLQMGVDGSLNAAQTEQLQKIERSGNYLLQLISQLLDLGAVGAGRIQATPEPVDLGELVDLVVSMLAPKADAKGLALRSRLNCETKTWCTDRRALTQILVNLDDNAIKFTEAGSVDITVNLLSERNLIEQIEIQVEDTGIGIAPDDMDQIFDLFFQEEPGQDFQGVGIGLHLCQELASVLGGRIEAASERSVGSRFSLRIPELVEG